MAALSSHLGVLIIRVDDDDVVGLKHLIVQV
jgi:hypothetical protein